MKNSNKHLLDNFPVVVYWQNEEYLFQGGNLELRRNLCEIFHPKFALKRLIFDEQMQVLGSIAFQISNFKLADYPPDNDMENNDSETNINLDFVFDNAPVAFWIKDKNHVFIDGNAHALRAAGVSSSQEFLGKTLSDFTKMKGSSSSKIKELHNIENQIFQTGEEKSHIESKGLCNSELSFMHQIAWAQRPILDKDKQVIAIAGVGFFNDEQTRNAKFIVPESQITSFMGQKTINFN